MALSNVLRRRSPSSRSCALKHAPLLAQTGTFLDRELRRGQKENRSSGAAVYLAQNKWFNSAFSAPQQSVWFELLQPTTRSVNIAEVADLYLAGERGLDRTNRYPAKKSQ
jgi:hypothetical protein